MLQVVHSAGHLVRLVYVQKCNIFWLVPIITQEDKKAFLIPDFNGCLKTGVIFYIMFLKMEENELFVTAHC